MLLFQDLQDADMSDTTRATAGKHQADPRPVCRRRHLRGGRVRGILRDTSRARREAENGTKNVEYPETGPDRPW